MPDQDVSIQYRAVVTGAGDVKDLADANSQLNQQLTGTAQKSNEAGEAQKKHASIAHQLHAEVRELHRELYVGVGIIGLVTLGLTSMSKGSESAQIGLETLTGAMNTITGAMGNTIAKITAFAGALAGGANMAQAWKVATDQINASRSLDTQVKVLTLEAQTYKLQGDEMMAMQKKHEAEQTALKKDGITQRYQILKAALDKEQAAETDAYKLSELGLKSHIQIMNDFKKNLVGGALEGSTENVLEKTLSGQPQSGADVLKTFQAGFAHAIAEAISQSFWTSVFSGGNFFENLKNIFTGRTPAVIAAERAAKASEDMARKDDEILAVLRQIAECTCSTAQSIGRGYTATITPPQTSGIQKALAISNLVGSIGNLGGFIGGLGGGSGGGGTTTGGTTVEPTNTVTSADGRSVVSYYGGQPQLPDGVQLAHSSGSWVPSFPSGGEVPITAQPGEYIVRRAQAAQNKDLLEDINKGKSVKGTPNVFIINANDAASFAAMLTSPSAQSQIEIAVIRSIMNNGNLRNIMKNYAR